MKAVIALVLALAQATAFAQALAPVRDGTLTPRPAAPAVAFTQHLDARLPMTASFTDSTGHSFVLADEFAPRTARPTLLMLGYHRCPQLCGLAMQGLQESLRASGLPPSAWRILFVSVDPSETVVDAAARHRVDLAYAKFLAGDASFVAPDIERLVAAPASIAALASRVGFVYLPDDEAARFAHPTGVVVVTPDGHVSRYLMGVRFDPSELREAVQVAADGHVGTLSDRLALLCAHLDVRVGGHSNAVLVGMRVAGMTTLALLAFLVWRQRARHRREPR